LRGNPKALAALSVAAVCLAIAFAFGSPSINTLTSVMVGAAVSSAVAYVVAFLQEPGDRQVPAHLIRAVQREVDLAGYYREYQEFAISLAENDSVEFSFFSRLVPIDGRAPTIKYPKVIAPHGLEPIREEYRLGGVELPPASDMPIKVATNQEFAVKYRIKNKEQVTYFDTHTWACPILRYDVYVTLPKEFGCTVRELVGDAELTVGPQSRLHFRKTVGEVHFAQENSAFSRQGFQWKIFRHPAAVA
jgi:hypothetical protein